jgi:membrane associated rhomboid family serine protease
VKPEMAQPVTDADRRRGASVRTALTLASIALVFFGGIIYAQYSGEPTVGMSVLGFGVFGFLLVAIGRNLRK